MGDRQGGGGEARDGGTLVEHVNQYKRTNSPDPCCCLVHDREDSDPRNIANAEIVSLRGFTTKVRAALLWHGSVFMEHATVWGGQKGA